MGHDMRILLTGFGGFPGQSVNPTAQLMDDIEGKLPDVETRILPTEYKGGIAALDRALDEIRPQIVICFGVAAGSNLIRLEVMARNAVNARAPDAAGFAPAQTFISKDGPEIYMGTMPVELIERQLNNDRLVSRFSSHAGDYVCNYAFYQLMQRRARQARMDEVASVAGFVHVPLPDGPAGLSRADLCDAAMKIVQTSRNHYRVNLSRVAGARLDDPHPL